MGATIKIIGFIIPLLFGKLPQEGEYATIVIYQGSSYWAQNFDLYLGDQSLLSPMKKNTSIEVKVPTGELDLKTVGKRYMMETNHYVLEVKSGNTYYMKASLAYNFPLTGLELVISNHEQYQKLEPKLEKIIVGEKVGETSYQ